MTTDEHVEDRDLEGDLGPSVGGGANTINVVEGPIGGASLREPSEVEAEGAGADLAARPDVNEVAGPETSES